MAHGCYKNMIFISFDNNVLFYAHKKLKFV